MNNERLQNVLNRELIQMSLEKGLKVHLILQDRTWRNGYVLKCYPDSFDFKDTENKAEAFFFLQVFNVEPFKGGGGNKNG